MPDPERIDKGSTKNVAQNAADVELVSYGYSRLGVTIWNDSTATLYVRLADEAASTTNASVKIAPGGYYETPYNYGGAIHGIWDAAGAGAARITEII